MCTSPLKGFHYGITENGKKNMVITSYNVDHIEFVDGKKVRCFDDTIINKESALTEFTEIPCGQCIECRLMRSRRWADRCMLELAYHESSYFLTLTYDNEHIPKNPLVDDDGVIYAENATLVKKDLQDFMKRLRRAYEYAGYTNKLRFFACGEYGSDTLRPHFHIIVFGLTLTDLQLYRRNFNNDCLYNSEFVSKCWKKGFAVIGNVSWNACAYVARYIMKKHLGKDSTFYDDYNIEPEFVLMSRKPGIARQYYDDHKDELFYQDFVSISTPEGGKNIYPPPYYEKLFEIDFPDNEVVERKERRKENACVNKKLILEKTDKNYIDYLKVKEYNIGKKLESLKRHEI